VPLKIVQAALIKVFWQWGLPRCIKVDNGRPFGDPQLQVVPILALWLIGLGIKVIWNRPRQPTDNAIVERGQGVLNCWIEPEKCGSVDELQKKLLEEARFQREVYPVQRLGNKTRVEYFPQLMQPGSPYRPKDFQLKRVLDFLAEGQWERTVSSVGQFRHYGQRMQAGMKHKNQQISIKLDAAANEWMVFDRKGECIGRFPTPFTQEAICNLEFELS
jgi:hypothetical protein